MGRIFGIIGFLSQTGFALAYMVSGASADFIARLFHISSGRGAAMVIQAAGALMIVTALISGYMGMKR